MDVELATPALFISGSVIAGDNSHVLNPPPSGLIFLIQGIDAYPEVQPNNGDFVVTYLFGGGTGQATLFQVQQSANFPGPFEWRGQIPFYAGSGQINITSTVPFAFTIWGLSVPNFISDSLMAT